MLRSYFVLFWFWVVVERWWLGVPTYNNCKRGCRVPYTEVSASLLVCIPESNSEGYGHMMTAFLEVTALNTYVLYTEGQIK